jgi:putative tryptophan/tyrosine transport system substrate-binding protein
MSRWLTERARKAAMPAIGSLNNASAVAFEHLTPVFRDGLSEAGYVDGRNISIDYSLAEAT